MHTHILTHTVISASFCYASGGCVGESSPQWCTLKIKHMLLIINHANMLYLLLFSFSSFVETRCCLIVTEYGEILRCVICLLPFYLSVFSWLWNETTYCKRRLKQACGLYIDCNWCKHVVSILQTLCLKKYWFWNLYNQHFSASSPMHCGTAFPIEYV